MTPIPETLTATSTDKDILNDLLGGGGEELHAPDAIDKKLAAPGALKVQAPDAAEFAALPRGDDSEDALNLNRPRTPPLPAAQKLDAQHSVAAGGRGYAVTVAGEYYVLVKGGNGRDKTTRKYELTFRLPQIEGALSKILKHLLNPALEKMDPEAKGYRTHSIVKASAMGESPAVNNLRYVPREALVKYLQDSGAPVNIADFDGAPVEDLREVAIDFAQNPVGFAERERKRAARRAEAAELRRMNPELHLP